MLIKNVTGELMSLKVLVRKISQFPCEVELLLNSGKEMVIKSVSIGSIRKIHFVLDLLG